MSDSDNFTDDVDAEDEFSDEQHADESSEDSYSNSFGPDDRHSDPNDFGRRPRSSGGMGGCGKVAIGCGGLVLVLLIAAGIGGWWIANNLQNVGGAVGAMLLKAGVGELKLPDAQEQRIFDRIDQLALQIQNGEISEKEGEALIRNIFQGPLFPAAMAQIVERAYLDASGLDDEEKAAARLTIRRFTHGAVREMIPEDAMNSVLDFISTRNANNERQFKDKLTDEELRAFLEAAKAAADDASVPDDVPAINFADEFDKAVDAALEKPVAGDAEETDAMDGSEATDEEQKADEIEPANEVAESAST